MGSRRLKTNFLEDTHHQFIINDNLGIDIILRANDEGTKYEAFDVFDYENCEYLYTSNDIQLGLLLLKLHGEEVQEYEAN
jgi:hypothetical protein